MLGGEFILDLFEGNSKEGQPDYIEGYISLGTQVTVRDMHAVLLLESERRREEKRPIPGGDASGQQKAARHPGRLQTTFHAFVAERE
jgi:hypothetical protein